VDLLGEGKLRREILYNKNDEFKNLIEKWKMEKELFENRLENYEGNQKRVIEVKESFNDLKKFSSKIREIFGTMNVETRKEFFNFIFESRSIEVSDERRLKEEEGTLFRGKGNSFELRGIEGLSLEKAAQFLNGKAISNNDDALTIQLV
jgi:hypothetical protein